jgi:hypothetical protein
MLRVLSRAALPQRRSTGMLLILWSDNRGNGSTVTANSLFAVSLLWPACVARVCSSGLAICCRPHSSVCANRKLNFDPNISDLKCFSIAIRLVELRPAAPCVHYLAWLEKTATRLIRTVRPSRRFDASVGRLVEGHFATVLERDGPEKSVAIPGFIGVCELKRCLAVVLLRSDSKRLCCELRVCFRRTDWLESRDVDR